MSFSAISSSLIGAKKAIIHGLWTLIKGNFEDHQSRINALENSPQAEPGTIIQYGNVSVPTGWLACDGSEVSQSTYADLYAIVGTTWNTGGEAGGNFRLPDFRGRALIGKGTGSGLTARTLAASVGTETHVLASGELPSHGHTLTDPTHVHSGPKFILTGGGATISVMADAGTPAAPTHGTTSNATGVTFANTGGGGAHNNMAPSLACYFLIKT